MYNIDRKQHGRRRSRSRCSVSADVHRRNPPHCLWRPAHQGRPTFGGIGYGFGYASAEDNICEILDRMMTVSGHAGALSRPRREERKHRERPLPPAPHPAGRGRDDCWPAPPDSPDTPSPEARALARGYVAGLQPLCPRDRRRRHHRSALQGRALGARDHRDRFLAPHVRRPDDRQRSFAPVATAAPPSAAASLTRRRHRLRAISARARNAYGLGSEVTKGGRGMLLGNPHYPWDGPNRFYRTHFTIPGKLNVVGVSYIGMPLIRMGHTDRIAWSNTVSTARRYGYFELKLDPADPTAYIYEGKSTPMQRTEVTVAGEGRRARHAHALFDALRAGRLQRDLPVDEASAPSRCAPSQVGLRDVDQYMSVWQSSRRARHAQALARYQSYRFNTTAADFGRRGASMATLGMIPNVHAEARRRMLHLGPREGTVEQGPPARARRLARRLRLEDGRGLPPRPASSARRTRRTCSAPTTSPRAMTATGSPTRSSRSPASQPDLGR